MQAKADGLITEEVLGLITDDYESTTLTDMFSNYRTKDEIDEKIRNIEIMLEQL